jgi:regulator of replication initiation timing
MALDDAALKLTVTADVAPFVSAMNQCVGITTTGGDRMAASFKYVAASSTEATAAMKSVGASAAQAGVATAGMNRSMAEGTARIAAFEAGAGGLGHALGRVAAQSAVLGEILSAAFPVFAIVAAVTMVTDLSEKFDKLREEGTATITKWDDFSASVMKQSDSLQVENLKLEDTIAKLEGHPEPNQLEIALVQAKEKSDELVTSLENAATKAQELLESTNIGLWDQVLGGTRSTSDISGALKGPIADYQRALAELNLAQESGNQRDIEAARKNAEEKRALIVSVADEQIAALQKSMNQALAAVPSGKDASALADWVRQGFAPALTMAEQVKASFTEMGTISRRSDVNAGLQRQAAIAQVASDKQKALTEEYKASWEALERFEKTRAKFEEGYAKALAQSEDALDKESEAVAKFGAESYVADAKSQLESFQATAREQISQVEGAIAAAEAKASARGRSISGAEFLTGTQKQTAEKDVLAEQYATEAAAIQPLIANLQAEQAAVQLSALDDEKKALAVKQLQDQIDALTNKLGALKAKMDDIGQDNWAVQLGNKVHTAFGQMNTTVNSSLQQWEAGHRTFGQAMYQTWRGIEQDAFMSLVKITEKTVEQLVIRRVATIASEQATVAAKGAAAAEGAAISKGSAFQEQFAYAKAAAAKAYSALASIPIVGPELGAVAAAGAFTLLMAFQKGGIVPEDTPAYLHREEMVLPERISTFIQERVAEPALAGAGAGGGDTHLHFSATAMDAKSLVDFFSRNRGAAMKEMARAFRNGARLRR